MSLRIVTLASGRGSNIEALANAIGAGCCTAELVGVIADRIPCLALERAQQRGLATRAVCYQSHPQRQTWETDLLAEIQSFHPDLVVLAGFMRVLTAITLDAFKGRIINIHPSLLPSFRGAHAVRDALAAGVHITGCSVHLVDVGIDTGPILAQAAVAVAINDNEMSLHKRIQQAEHQLLPAVVAAVASGALLLGPPPQWQNQQPPPNTILSPDMLLSPALVQEQQLSHTFAAATVGREH